MYTTNPYATKDYLYGQTPKKAADYRTLAFYKFHPLEAARLPNLRKHLLLDLAKWDIVGRIYIATEGINAQLSCPTENLDALQAYCDKTVKPILGGSLMDLNLGTEHGPGAAFRALHVRIRKQLVADGLDPASYNLGCQPSHLSPAEWHQKLTTYKKKHGKDPVVIDMRNHYESDVGYFEGAVRPDVDTFRESVTAMNAITKDLPRDEEIFMYCTGGIRCSKAGAILQSASGFDTVHLVAGGVTAYGRWIRDQTNTPSLFRGKNFTFDARLGETITDDVIGQCQICGQPANRHQNCAHTACNLLLICCPACQARFRDTCGRIECYDTVHNFHTHAKDGLLQPAGPTLVDGVRAYVKHGHHSATDPSGRVVVGKHGQVCELDHNQRVRAMQVLGQPGDVLKTWVQAGRHLPPSPSPSEAP